MGINCSYEILDPKSNYKPKDKISGVFYIENTDDKEKKLKDVEIHLVEKFEQYIERGSFQGNQGSFQAGWVPRSKDIKKYQVAKGDKIGAGEKKEYTFELELPGKIMPRKGGGYQGWHVLLAFMQKTGMRLTTGDDPESAELILPVDGSAVFPTISTSEAKVETSEDMKFCSECGQKIKRTSKFCEHCGSPN